MASKIEKKFKKQKARERDSKLKVQQRRVKLRQKSKEAQEEFLKMKRIRRLQRKMGDLNIWSDETFKNLDEDALLQVEHNAEILKALEEEYEQERAQRQELNEELESQGHKTLEDKLRALSQAAMQGTDFENVGAMNNMIIAPKKVKEVADVEVIKASKVQPDSE